MRRRTWTAMAVVCLLVGAVTRPAAAIAPTVHLGVDATSDRGAAAHRLQGVLGAPHESDDIDAIRRLRLSGWRNGGIQATESDGYDLMRRHGAPVMWIIGDDWKNTHGATEQPWTNWNDFETFVKRTVQRRMAEAPVTYWDMFNEPDLTLKAAAGNDDPSNNVALSPLLLEMFRREHDAIRSVDPNAFIVGPSISLFRAGTNNLGPLDLDHFLTYAEVWGLRIDALSWHEIHSRPNDVGAVLSPRSVVDHVAQARAMIDAHPGLVVKPKIFIDEWAAPGWRKIPGWSAGMLAAMEDADVEWASRSCWGEKDTDGRFYGTCGEGLNDLFLADESPQANYWVHRAYADMTGVRVPVTGSDTVTSAFATRDSAAQEVRVLVGRHQQRCQIGADPATELCTSNPADDAAPADVEVAVKVPFAASSLQLLVQRIPSPTGHQVGLAAPITVQSTTVAVTGGVATVTIPGYADGEAYTIRLGVAPPAAPPTLPPFPGFVCPMICGGSGSAGTWSTTGSSESPRERHATAALGDGRVLTSGGNSRTFARDATKVYDPANGGWTWAGNMAGALRERHTATTLADGSVFIAGGFGTGTLNTSERYDPATGTFTFTGWMTGPRSDHTATLLSDGRVLVVGGFSGGQDLTPVATAEVWNPTTGSWAPVAPMPGPRALHTATRLPNGKVLVAGGVAADGTLALATTALYDPVANTWTTASPMAGARARHRATALNDGSVVVTGGGSIATYTEGVAALASVERYNPVTGLWTPLGALPAARELHTATRLANGRVLVAGGIGPNGALASAAELNPATGVFTPVAPMSVPRYLHTATLLPNGQVVVVGGVSGARPDGIESSSELYNA
jgi:hypothetical protein